MFTPKENSLARSQGEIQRFARNKEERVLGIPLVLWPPIVRLEPSAILIVFKVEDVQIAIGVHIFARSASLNTAP